MRQLTERIPDSKAEEESESDDVSSTIAHCPRSPFVYTDDEEPALTERTIYVADSTAPWLVGSPRARHRRAASSSLESTPKRRRLRSPRSEAADTEDSHIWETAAEAANTEDTDVWETALEEATADETDTRETAAEEPDAGEEDTEADDAEGTGETGEHANAEDMDGDGAETDEAGKHADAEESDEDDADETGGDAEADVDMPDAESSDTYSDDADADSSDNDSSDANQTDVSDDLDFFCLGEPGSAGTETHDEDQVDLDFEEYDEPDERVDENGLVVTDDALPDDDDFESDTFDPEGPLFSGVVDLTNVTRFETCFMDMYNFLVQWYIDIRHNDFSQLGRRATVLHIGTPLFSEMGPGHLAYIPDNVKSVLERDNLSLDDLLFLSPATQCQDGGCYLDLATKSVVGPSKYETATVDGELYEARAYVGSSLDQRGGVSTRCSPCHGKSRGLALGKIGVGI